MRATLVLAVLSASIQAINLEAIAHLKLSQKVIERLDDGPTNGEMTDDEKDNLIQVLCPGNVVTSFSLASGHSSTCNHGAPDAKLVQQSESTGDVTVE